MATTTVRRAGDGTGRLYVSAVDGRRLGWHDLGSGATHLEDSEAGTLVGDAVARWVASRSPLRRQGVRSGVLGTGTLGAGHMGTGPIRLGTTRTGSAVTGTGSLRTGPLGTGSSGAGWLGTGSLGRESLGTGSLGTESFGTGSFGTGLFATGTGAAGGEPQPEDLRERGAGETTARALLQALPATVPTPGTWLRLLGRDPLAPVNRLHHAQVLAERRVGRLLAGLDRWRSLHCVPVATGQTAHHLLVGPGGVVVVRTCAHPGEVVSVVGEAVLAAGLPSEVLREARSQAAVVAERLTRRRGARVPVHALVLVAGARRLDVAGEVPRGVTVLREADLLRWLQDRPTVLSSVEVERFARAAARPATWPGSQTEPPGEVVGLPADMLVRGRRGRRRHEALRLQEWSTAVSTAARARLLGRLALLAGVLTAAPVVVSLAVGAA